MRFAYLIMGKDYDPAVDRAAIGGGKAQIIGVPNLESACEVAKELMADGVDDIEVCGAFKKEGADALVAATEGGCNEPVEIDIVLLKIIQRAPHYLLHDEINAPSLGKDVTSSIVRLADVDYLVAVPAEFL